MRRRLNYFIPRLYLIFYDHFTGVGVSKNNQSGASFNTSKPLIPKFVPVYCQPFVDFSVRMCHRHWRLSYFSHARSLDAIGYVL
jgi:hypothetical protein